MAGILIRYIFLKYMFCVVVVWNLFTCTNFFFCSLGLAGPTKGYSWVLAALCARVLRAHLLFGLNKTQKGTHRAPAHRSFAALFTLLSPGEINDKLRKSAENPTVGKIRRINKAALVKDRRSH
jgi:hypothetical protein